MRTVITGGCGFLGRLIAERLIGRGDDVVLFDIAEPLDGLGDISDKVEIRLGDITNYEIVKNLISGADAVVHLASMVSAGSEADFDAAMRVNLDGGRNVLESSRANGPATRVLFTSSLAIFGSDRMPMHVDEMTRPVPQNTYGMTKAVIELLLNDMSRKGFVDGRIARLPTIIVRPGKPNTAASSFASGVIREPLMGDECCYPVPLDMTLMVGGYRACADALVVLLDAPADAFGDDRVVNLPNITVSVAQMMEATRTVAARHGIELGPIVEAPDANVQKIVGAWPTSMDASRALALGCPQPADLDDIIEDFISDYVH
ncbi:NAD-dependent epimerase/dehydratase family protein [Rhodospirillales bacterium]|jgi:nucleoside-diphosphate-sugar epimerase|nr:NAD-dependent epimerase/dehydratase family protein [Rhodospirillales bacterium]